MITPLQKRIPAALRLTLLVGLASSFFIATTAPAQEAPAAPAAPTKMKPTVVTGSLIPTFETITPQPVDVYTSADIEKTGVTSVPQLIQRLPAISGNASYGD